jgi:predicted DNA-binding transcriptional regulator YafY
VDRAVSRAFSRGTSGQGFAFLRLKDGDRPHVDQVIADLRRDISAVPELRVFITNPPPISLASGGVRGAQYTFTLQDADPDTLYRDMAELQAMRIPIEGERGIGYVLRPGFTLPPLMFTVEETEAMVVALGLLARRGDAELRGAAQRVEEKIAASIPPPLRDRIGNGALRVWGSMVPDRGLDLALARRAIREEARLALTYRDEQGRESDRVIRPVALIYYSETANLVGWCELRRALRHFRPDRVVRATLAGGHFRGDGDRLRRLWTDSWVREGDAREHPAAT